MVSVKASDEADAELGTAAYVAIGANAVAIPVVFWSLFVLKNTGCGLPPGPGGLLGATEGLSYLAVFGLVGWSAYTKVRTGSGLPAGPYGLLGAVEGMGFLAVLAVIVVFGLQFADFGFIPGPLPGEACFGN